MTNRHRFLLAAVGLGAGCCARAGLDQVQRCQREFVQKLFVEISPRLSLAEYRELRQAIASRPQSEPDAPITNALKGFRKAQDDFRSIPHDVSPSSQSLQHHQLLEKLAARADELARIINQHVGYRRAIQYEVLPMDRHYIAEIRAWARYFDADEQAAAKLSFRQGLIFDAQGRPFDTRQARSLTQPLPGELPMAIFVMDERGDFYVTNAFEKRVIHHSSLVQGRPVAFAGEMAVENGELRRLGDRSGHYRLPPPFRRQVLRALQARQINLRSIEFEFADAAAIIASPSPDERDSIGWDDRLASAGAHAMLGEFEIYKRRAPAIYASRLRREQMEHNQLFGLLRAVQMRPDPLRVTPAEIESLINEIWPAP